MSFEGKNAIDCGGPKVEFFRLPIEQAKNTLFIGDEGKKFFLNNICALQVKIDFLSLLHYMKFLYFYSTGNCSIWGNL